MTFGAAITIGSEATTLWRQAYFDRSGQGDLTSWDLGEVMTKGSSLDGSVGLDWIAADKRLQAKQVGSQSPVWGTFEVSPLRATGC